MVYFASRPSPRQMPAPHQARGRSSTSAHQRKKSAPLQAAASGASGVITTPLVNEKGSAATSARQTVAAVLPSQRYASAAEKPALASEHAIEPARTPHSPWPNSAVPDAISHATSGG